MIPSTPSITFTIRVHPRAKKDAVTGTLGDAYKVSITAPPAEGRANEACVELLAKVLEVPRSSITIAAGQSSRTKVIRVTGRTGDEVRAALARELAK